MNVDLEAKQIKRKKNWLVFNNELTKLYSQLQIFHGSDLSSDKRIETNRRSNSKPPERNVIFSKLQIIRSSVRFLQNFTFQKKLITEEIGGKSSHNVRFSLSNYCLENSMPELSVADMCILNFKFKSLINYAETVQKIFLPRGKFLFHRYFHFVEKWNSISQIRTMAQSYSEFAEPTILGIYEREHLKLDNNSINLSYETQDHHYETVDKNKIDNKNTNDRNSLVSYDNSSSLVVSNLHNCEKYM